MEEKSVAIGETRMASASELIPGFLVCSPAIQKIAEQIIRYGDCRSTVLILGETGVGKELVAKALHFYSPRRSQPFVIIDCTTLRPELAESELFGHEHGAFTGAIDRKIGLFEAAQGGTVFLDEISELPKELQPKLLRALENGAIRRVGANAYREIDVRVIAATNRNLEDLVAGGAFREDLFWRLNVLSILVPPLRERPKDVPVLTEFFAKRVVANSVEFAPESITYLQQHSWPGNVRELRNTVERVLVNAKSGVISQADLTVAPCSHALLGRRDITPLMRNSSSLADFRNKASMEYIAMILERVQGKRNDAARLLGIDVATLYRLMRQYGIKK